MRAGQEEVLKILSLPVDDGGCGWYRIRQPFEMIRAHTPHDTHVIDKERDDMVELAHALRVASLVVGRPGSGEGFKQLLKHEEFSHLRYVLDIDDNVELISPYSAHYEEYGTEEFYDRNLKQWLWKDGERDFSLERNRAKLAAHLQEMRDAALVTVTTPQLADYARQYNENVVVLPNAINLENWWPIDRKPNRRVRIGYAGGVSHYEDIYSIREPLNRILREEDCEIVFVGSAFSGLIDEDNRSRMTVRPWVPFKGHSFHLMSLGIDVALVPLADLPFNAFKSAVKWYEMSAMGVPSVVTNITPYKEEISEETAVPYKTPQQFYKGLKMLVSDPYRRAKLGRSAQQWVKKHRDARKLAERFVNVYSRITAG